MSFETVLMPAMIVMGAELRTTFKDNACYTDIPAFWKMVEKNDIIASIPHKTSPHVLLGVYTNYTPDFSLTSGYHSLIVGVPVSSEDVIPSGMVVKHIPSSKYAVFTAKGPFATAIGKAWVDVWQNKDIQRTFTNDFEWYDANSTDDENSVVKIYIAIK